MHIRDANRGLKTLAHPPLPLQKEEIALVGWSVAAEENYGTELSC
jgi:hypothetical protein